MSVYKSKALTDKEFENMVEEIDSINDEEEQGNPCDSCSEKWKDNKQWDCPWHMNVNRCECY